MNNLEKSVIETLRKHNWDNSIIYRLLDLTSEVGELSKDILTSTDYGKSIDNITISKSELGDTLFSLIALIISTGNSIEEVLKVAIDKYNKRIK
jgi:NTP pyrophosphatase (non-canonical NTP hydrolase)